MRLLYSRSKDKTRRDMKEIGRNDPCPCGSGKKYKKCCAQKSSLQKRTVQQIESPQSASSMQKVTGALSQALRSIPPQAAKTGGDAVKKSLTERVKVVSSQSDEDEDEDPKE